MSTPCKTKRSVDSVKITPRQSKSICVINDKVGKDLTEQNNPITVNDEMSIMEEDNTDQLECEIVYANKQFRDWVLDDIITEDLIFKDNIENQIYCYKFQIENFTDSISFGYCLTSEAFSENDAYITLCENDNQINCKNELKVDDIKPIIDARIDMYEIIYDMVNKRMSIRQGNNTVQTICRINSSLVHPCVRVTNGIVRFISCSILPLYMIKRYIINDYSDGKNEVLQLARNIPQDPMCNVVSYTKNIFELYTYNNYVSNEDTIEYVVFHKIFNYLNNNKNNFKIYEVMESGIYHFYFEIISVGNSKISFGFTISEKKNPTLFQISGEKGEIYELIYDMNIKIMWIKQENGDKIQLANNLPSSIYPCISVGNKEGSVRLIEYYKEGKDNCLFNAVNVINGEADLHGIKVPNTIYSIYNYEKYYKISELLSIKSNSRKANIFRIKSEIRARFKLEKIQNDYLETLYSYDDLIVFLKYFDDETANQIDYPDNFVKIVNNLKIVDLNKLIIDKDGKLVESGKTKEYLDFTEAYVKVFQFPMNKIYIRDCYDEMFNDICIIMSIPNINCRIVITGQPGIGKTSFIYILLYKMMNLFKKEKLIKEIEDIHKKLNELQFTDENGLNNYEKNEEELTEEIMNHQTVIHRRCENINELKIGIVNNYEELKFIIEKEKEEKNKNNDKETDMTNEVRQMCLSCIDKCISVISNRKKYYKLEIDELDKNVLKENRNSWSNDTINCLCQLSLKIMKGIEEIDSIPIERLLVLLKTKIIELKYFNLNKSPKLKDIYVVKGKRGGSSDAKKIYLLRDGVIFKININLKDIKDSIIIVDTFNDKFDRSNKIISISSPDSKNYSEYKDVIIPHKDLYFDSLSFDEIGEWFVNCIGFDIHNRNRVSEFKKICNRYGNIPRQIYYHYLYNENYGKDYWDYYKQLIEGVIGSIGYEKFKNKYKNTDILQDNASSNLILKYNLQNEWDNDLLHNVLQPKEGLIYISKAVENYIRCKFYPPTNNSEYNKVKNEYNAFSDNDTYDDIYMKRMLLKQKVAFELSTNNNVIACDPKFKLNSEKEVSVYYPENALNLIYFILDDNNFFDLIMDGVFIKVLLDDKKLDNDEIFNKDKISNDIKKAMQDSIRECSEIKSGWFVYCVITPSERLLDINFEVPLPSPTSSTTSASTLPTTSQSTTASYVEDNEEEDDDDDKPLTKAELEEISANEEKVKNERMKNNKRKEEEEEKEDFNVYVGDYGICLMRKCFDDMLNIICKDDFGFPYQRNYLIFGHSRIGKTILGSFLNDKLKKELQGRIEVFYEYENEQNNSKKENFGKGIADPYIVIVDGPAVGEDDYPDAKMIIMLAKPSEKKCKTFQSKRCPLLMYIPPFTLKEVKQVIQLKLTTFNVNKDFTTFHSMNVVRTVTDSKIINECKLMKDNYKYHGGIIGLCNNNESSINLEIVNLDLIKDIMRGITKSPLSKTEYQNVFIYETDENDVTKSNNLRFISETIREMVYKKLFTINKVEDCKDMINVYRNNPTGGIGGNLYEKIILYLMNKSPDFRSEIVKRMIKLIENEFQQLRKNKTSKNSRLTKDEKQLLEIKKLLMSNNKTDDKPNNEKIVIPKDVEGGNKLQDEIENFKKYNDGNIIPIIDFSYHHQFPDIDALIGPFGIQITVGDEHKYAPEMSMILHNLYKIYSKGYKKNTYKRIDRNINVGYFFISNKANVKCIKVFDRDTEYYPESFQMLTRNDLDDNNKQRLYDEAKLKKKTITVTYQDLIFFYDKMLTTINT